MYTAYLKGSLKLDKQGYWFHNEKPVLNKNISIFFNRHIVWDEDSKEYYIQYGKGRATFDYEDTPYFITQISINKNITFLLNDESEEELKNSELFLGNDNSLYAIVKKQHYAKIQKNVFQILINYLEDEKTLRINDKVIKINEKEKENF